MTTPIAVNIILGTTAADVLLGLNGNDNIAGHDGDDTINGGGGKDLLLGNEGNDYLDGGNSADILYGGLHNDFLLGGAGADWLSGDQGFDTLRGGSGADTFFFNGKTAGVDGYDTIIDFSVADGDKLSFGKFAPGSSLSFVQNGANVDVYVNSNNFMQVALPVGLLVATVLNSSTADVGAASSFVDLMA